MSFGRSRVSGGRGIYIKKAFTWRFVLDTLKSRKFPSLVKNIATVDVYGCILYGPHWRLPLWHCAQCRRIYIHGVGFCVARSIRLGNARASECGTGDG